MVDLLGLATPPWERWRPRRQVLAGITGISQDGHSPKLVTPSRDGVARPDECGRGECDGPVRAPALPGSRATAFTAQYSSPQAGIVLPAQMSAVVVNPMGRRGRRRSQDHAPRHSPPDPHSPHMGRGSCRTDGAWSIFGVGAPRITRRGIHRPMLIPCTWVVVPAGLMGTWSISWGLALPGARRAYRFTSCAAM